MIARSHLLRCLGTAMLPLTLAACTGRDTDAGATTGATTGATAAAGDTVATTPPAASAEDRDDVVERALDGDSTLQVFGLDADDDDNRIVLKGAVRTADQKDLAARIATREAAGVAVDNRIRVDPNARATRPVDVDEIEDNVEDALDADSTLRGLNLDVDEDNGQIVLEGTVRTAAQRATVDSIAKRLAGNVKVVNRLRTQ